MSEVLSEESVLAIAKLAKAGEKLDKAAADFDAAWRAAWPSLPVTLRLERWRATYDRMADDGKVPTWNRKRVHRSIVPDDYDGTFGDTRLKAKEQPWLL